MSTPNTLYSTLERLLQHIDGPSYSAFDHGYTIAAVRGFVATINDLLAAISAAYSAHGWVTNEEFICLLEEVAKLAGIVEDGWDASASPDDTKAKARAATIPATPAAPEVGALVASLRKLQRRAMDEGSNNGDRLNEAVELDRIATLLSQQAAPTPPAPAPEVVPVAMEALARLYWWGGGAWSYGYSADVDLGVRDWINGGMAGDLPPLPARVADRCPPLPQAGEVPHA